MSSVDSSWYERRGLRTAESFGHFLETCAGFWPDREVVSFGDVRYSYGDLHRWSLAAARQLVEMGLRPGGRVMIQAVNSVELLVAQRVGDVMGGHGVAPRAVDVQANGPDAVRQRLQIVDKSPRRDPKAEIVVDPVADEIIDMDIDACAVRLCFDLPFHARPPKKKAARRSI